MSIKWDSVVSKRRGGKKINYPVMLRYKPETRRVHVIQTIQGLNWVPRSVDVLAGAPA